jgi:hypothetical protein
LKGIPKCKGNFGLPQVMVTALKKMVDRNIITLLSFMGNWWSFFMSSKNIVIFLGKKMTVQYGNNCVSTGMLMNVQKFS